MRVIVVGAGVVGVATAWYLRARGCSVSVFEQADQPGSGTSRANGGLLHVSHAEPWNAPGVLWQALRWLGRSDAPLLLRPHRLPALGRWGGAFLRASRPDRFTRSVRANTRLALYALDQLRALQQALALPFDHSPSGVLKLYRQPAELAAAAARLEAVRDLGVRSLRLEPAGAVALEPALAPVADRLAGAIHFPGDACGDAHLFTRHLAGEAERAGVVFHYGKTVHGLRQSERGCVVVTAEGPDQADAVVLAAGCAVPRLAATVGLRVPVEPVKGYSCTLPVGDWSQAPRLGLIDDQHKIVVSRLGDRLRLAGTAEFAGHDLTLQRARSDNIVRQVCRTLPGLASRPELARRRDWCGLRPMSADGRPLIGPTRIPGLLLNAGPGHLGWTFACGMGRLLADRITGSDPALPLVDFLPSRFPGL